MTAPLSAADYLDHLRTIYRNTVTSNDDAGAVAFAATIDRVAADLRALFAGAGIEPDEDALAAAALALTAVIRFEQDPQWQPGGDAREMFGSAANALLMTIGATIDVRRATEPDSTRCPYCNTTLDHVPTPERPCGSCGHVT